MQRSIVFLIIMIVWVAARADNLTLKYGLGFGLPDQTNLSASKYLSVGYQMPFGPVFNAKMDAGGWFDSNETSSDKSSGFATASVGMRVDIGPLYIDNYFGTAWLTTTDGLLGIPFEFTEEFGIGLKDEFGRSTGVQYRHFSNAGISSINKGRDFVLVNIGIPI